MYSIHIASNGKRTKFSIFPLPNTTLEVRSRPSDQNIKHFGGEGKGLAIVSDRKDLLLEINCCVDCGFESVKR